MPSTNEIWDEFSQALLNFIRSRIQDQSVAEDILQEVFIKIHLKLPSLKEESKLTSWVYQITRNTIIDFHRKKKVYTDEETLAIELPEELSINDKDFSKCINSFLNELPQSDKDILINTSVKNISQKEYAAITGANYSAIKSKTQRARKKLKALFVSCCEAQTDGYGNIISSKDDCDCGC